MNPAGLRRFTRPATTVAAEPSADTGPALRAGEERCELCGTTLSHHHGHVVDSDKRSIVCACRPCYLLFTAPGAAGGRYRAVPERVHHDPAHPLSTVDWESLQVPVGIAFFFRNSALDCVVASYPSPGGATECELDLTEWARLADTYPLLRMPVDDLEGILVNRTAEGIETFLIPIDLCYALVGEVRLRWRGLDGGDEVRQSVAAFLADLRHRSSPLPRPPTEA